MHRDANISICLSGTFCPNLIFLQGQKVINKENRRKILMKMWDKDRKCIMYGEIILSCFAAPSLKI